MSVKRSSRRERPEAVLFERSEFTDDSERRMRSSEAGAALIFAYFSIKGKVGSIISNSGCYVIRKQTC